MAQIIAPAWEKIIGIGGLVATVWSEVTLTMTADQTDRFNWRELIDALEDGDDRGLPQKFVVMQVGPAIESNDVPVVTMQNTANPISLHYIRPNVLTSGEQLAESTVADILLERMEAMRDALRAGGHSDFQVISLPQIDVGDNNPANLVFLEKNHPRQAGTISFVAHVWKA